MGWDGDISSGLLAGFAAVGGQHSVTHPAKVRKEGTRDPSALDPAQK